MHRINAGRAASFLVLTFLALGGLAACGGGSGSPGATGGATTNPLQSSTPLQPSALGDAQCNAGAGEGSIYAQVAMEGTSCEIARSVAATAGGANGTSFTIQGFTCTPTKEGAGSTWASAWGGTYYAYSCKGAGAQVAFNSGRNYIYGGAGQSTATTQAGTIPPSPTGALQPAALGEGQCDLGAATGGSTYAQIAISGTTCDVAAMVGPASGSAQGGTYSVDGFSCSATVEGAGSPWASAWGGTYYAYSCKDGSAQVAFTWGKDYVYSG